MPYTVHHEKKLIPIDPTWKELGKENGFKIYSTNMVQKIYIRIVAVIVVLSILTFSIYYLIFKNTKSGRIDLSNIKNRKRLIYINYKYNKFHSITLNEDLKSQPKFYQSLKSQSLISFQNCQTIDEAQVILLGENHFIGHHINLEIAILFYFSRKGSTILFEGSDFDKKLDLKNSNVFSLLKEFKHSDSLKLYGWEKERLFKDQLKNLQDIFIPLKKMNTDNDLLIYMEQRAREFGIDMNNLEYDKIPQTLKAVLPPDIFKLFEKDLQAFQRLKRERDESLVEAILKTIKRHSNSKIFVLAGSAHLETKSYDILNRLPGIKIAKVLFHQEGRKMIPNTTWEEHLSFLSQKLAGEA